MSDESNAEAAPRPRFWRAGAVAGQLGISVRKVWKLIEEKRLRAQKIDGCTVISEEELERFAREEVAHYERRAPDAA